MSQLSNFEGGKDGMEIVEFGLSFCANESAGMPLAVIMQTSREGRRQTPFPPSSVRYKDRRAAKKVPKTFTFPVMTDSHSRSATAGLEQQCSGEKSFFEPGREGMMASL